MALALDGHVTGAWSSGTSFASAALTTANAGDVIVAFVSFNDTGTVAVSSLSTTGVIWNGTARKVSAKAANGTHLELWYGTASATLSSKTTTVNLSGAPSISASASIFGVSGANTSTISDSNGSLPGSATGAAGVVHQVTGISTSNANDMIIAGVGQSTVQTAAAGMTLIDGVTGVASEYEVVSATQSSVTIAFGSTSSQWAMIVDAIKAAASFFPSPHPMKRAYLRR